MYRDSLFHLNFTVKIQKCTNFIAFKTVTLIKVIDTEKLSEKIQNGPKWPFQMISDNFSQKDWYKFGMAKNGCSEFFLTIFPKKTGINSEWPKMCIPNLLKPFWCKKNGRNLEKPIMGILNLFKPF